MLSHGEHVSIVDLSNVAIVRTIALDCVFYGFIEVKERGLVLLIHELGVVAITTVGDELWRFNAGDVVTGYELRGDQLWLERMDAKPVSVRLSDGAL